MSALNILYQSNDSYAVVTGVSMTSLCESNRALAELNFYVLDDEISTDNRTKMERLCAQYGRTVAFLDTKEILARLLALKVAPFKGTYTTYFKLFALAHLEVPGDRVLQLDGDTIVVGSLAPLAAMDLGGALLAATYDCTMNAYKPLIGIPESDHYYNGGVLLVDLAAWRGERCEERIVEHLRDVRSGYYTVDQDILNVLFRERFAYLDPKYNFNSGFFIYGVEASLRMYGLREPYYSGAAEIKRAKASAVVLHCMGAMTGRPWEKDSIHPQNGLYDHYLALSPWAGTAKRVVKRALVFRVQRLLYRLLPRPLYIQLHRIAQRRYLAGRNRAVQG